MRRLLAATLLAGSAAITAAPAAAQPCVDTYSPGAFVCVVHETGPALRGVVAGVYGVDYALVVGGCYYPDGRPRYYVAAGTGTTGVYEVTSPVGGVPCV